MVADLRALTKRERQLLNSVDSAEKFLEGYDPTKDLRQVSVRIQVLEAVYSQYYEIRAQIELLLENIDAQDDGEDAKDKKDAEEREKANLELISTFENRYCALKAGLLEKLPHATNTQPPIEGRTQPVKDDAPFSKVKLPEIRLPSFSGKLREWVTFRDSFQSLINENPQLTAMDKFSYLRSALSGEALQEISSVELSAANYDVAWKALTERYENKKLIVKALLDTLFSVEGLRKESYDGLSHLISEFEKTLQMLGKVGEDTDGWSTILSHMVCSRLDSATLRHWETFHNSKEVPKYADLIAFLRTQCSVLQSVAPSKPPNSDQRSSKPALCHAVVKSSGRCQFCNESWHSPFQCGKFQRMKVAERNEAVAKSKLCRNCLQPGHFARFCERGECRHCHQKHHSMLHGAPARSSVPLSQSNPPTQNTQQRQPQSKPANSNQQQTQSANTVPTATQATPASTTNSHNPHSSRTQSATDHANTSQTFVALPITPTQNIILSTALVKICDRLGHCRLARALLDSCSQNCFMSKQFSRKLQFKTTRSYLSVQGIGDSQSISKGSISAMVGPRLREISDFTEEMQFHVLPKLTVSLPTASVSTTNWCFPASAFLADPQFHEPGPIDVIIGAEFYMDLLCKERHKATNEGPTLQNTVFGWIVSGRVPNSAPVEPLSVVHVCTTTEIEEQLSKFWELETCHSSSTNSTEESACEEIFEQTTIRDENGRFVVTLPKKPRIIKQLGDSKATAIRRFLSIERRLAGNADLKKQYTDFIHEYRDLGHMREVSEGDTEEKAYYLPHHAVLKPDSTTTKLRVVFDASCCTSTGVSLNNALMVGPVVQDDLLNIVLRFRLHRYAVVADIAKMYRMVRVQPEDQKFQRILWRDNVNEPIRTFELTTVTYGTASAPYLATKCLQSLAAEGKRSHPVGSKILGKDFYVDDMMSGVDDLEEGKTMIKETVDLLQSAGFSLRKWNSNSRELLLQVPEHLRDDRSILELDSSSSTVKTLGLVWEPSSDRFKFFTPSWNSSPTITKRTVLSDVSRIFDPLGLVGPVVIQAKMFIQDLWKLDCGWDDPLTEQLQEQWHEYRRNLSGLESLSVPRWVGVSNDVVAVQIHGFCDASEKAYGAALFVRTVSHRGEVSVQLLTAKSRVAPLENLKKGKKQQSIPRLELSSALLLAHLYEKVNESLHLDAKLFFWTDSMIVKCWLSSPPSRWKQFVANRVSEIQHITKDGVWNHVPGTENPADIISRGMTPAQLQYQSLWFHGPHWLSQREENWPKEGQTRAEEIDRSLLEEKEAAATLVAVTNSEIFNHQSSLLKLTRTAAYVRRFCFNARPANRNARQLDPLTAEELEQGLKTLVRWSQKENFSQEITDLSNNRPVRDSSKIASLNPRLIDGILCVGGRLENAAVAITRKHPFIIYHQHPLARSIVSHYHQKYYHAGQQLLLSVIRERFWPTSARNLIRSVLQECVDCFRARPKVQDQLMADLPPERVTQCFPFERVGVDYCGPFTVRYPQRKNQAIKSFVAIYICLVTKAVHIELAADLSTKGFLKTLRKFVSRRGTPQLIMCDNARNFVGARRELAEMHRLFRSQHFQNAVVTNAANRGIQFKFIPARSPNFGGLWESAVKSFKTLFKRSVGTQTLEYDEMVTVLAEVEAVLNSRPLTPLSNDPNDYEALTPGHFLIQRPLVGIPERKLTDTPESRLSMWEKSQKIYQLVWEKWSTQYLSDLNNRTKWTKQKDNLAVGTMVLLKEENILPLRWPLARVTEIHPGSDGNTRVVTVKTADGSYRRAISKICVLPFKGNNQPSDGEN